MSMKRTTYRHAKGTEKEKSFLAGVRRNIQTQIDERASATTAWSTITGKPSTYAPSTHAGNHNTGGSDAIQTASASQPGLLSAADWSKFNAASANYRSGSVSVSSGNPDVTFSSAFSDANYFLILNVYDSDGILGYNGITKSASKFTIHGLSANATVEYYATEYR